MKIQINHLSDLNDDGTVYEVGINNDKFSYDFTDNYFVERKWRTGIIIFKDAVTGIFKELDMEHFNKSVAPSFVIYLDREKQI